MGKEWSSDHQTYAHFILLLLSLTTHRRPVRSWLCSCVQSAVAWFANIPTRIFPRTVEALKLRPERFAVDALCNRNAIGTLLSNFILPLQDDGIIITQDSKVGPAMARHTCISM